MITTILIATNLVAFCVAFYFSNKCRKLENQLDEFQEQLEKNNVTVEFLAKIVDKKKKKKLSDSSGMFNLFDK